MRGAAPRSLLILFFGLAAIGVLAPGLPGQSVSGEVRTVYYAGRNPFSRAGDLPPFTQARDLAIQYAQLHLQDLGLRGLSFHTSFNLRDDLGEPEVFDRIPEESPREGDATSLAEVHRAYLEYRHGAGDWEIRAGRQLVYAGAGMGHGVGSGIVDGLMGRYRRGDLLRLTAFAGTLGIERAGRTAFGGAEEGSRWGAMASTEVLPAAALGVSFAETRRRGQTDARRGGIHAETRRWRGLQARTDWEYEHTNRRLVNATLGATYQPTPSWSFAGEYDRRRAGFPASSIFSVVTADANRQVRLSATRALPGGALLGGTYALILFDEDRSHSGTISLSQGGTTVGIRLSDGVGGRTTGAFALGSREVTRRAAVDFSLDWSKYDFSEGLFHRPQETFSGTLHLRWEPRPGVRARVGTELVVLPGDGLTGIPTDRVDRRFLAEIAYAFWSTWSAPATGGHGAVGPEGR